MSARTWRAQSEPEYSHAIRQTGGDQGQGDGYGMANYAAISGWIAGGMRSKQESYTVVRNGVTMTTTKDVPPGSGKWNEWTTPGIASRSFAVRSFVHNKHARILWIGAG